MKTYGSFGEMAADNMSQPVQHSGNELFNDTTLNRGQDAVVVHNYYGDGVQPTNDALSQIFVSLDAQETGDAVGERELDDPNTWKWLKTQPSEILTRIGVSVKEDGQNGGSRKIFPMFNTQTGKLILEGVEIADLSGNHPINAMIDACGSGKKKLVEAERVIWEYIDANPEKFIGG